MREARWVLAPFLFLASAVAFAIRLRPVEGKQ